MMHAMKNKRKKFNKTDRNVTSGRKRERGLRRHRSTGDLNAAPSMVGMSRGRSDGEESDRREGQRRISPLTSIITGGLIVLFGGACVVAGGLTGYEVGRGGSGQCVPQVETPPDSGNSTACPVNTTRACMPEQGLPIVPLCQGKWYIDPDNGKWVCIV